MKKIILAIALFSTIISFSQQAQWDAPLPEYSTTLKEYNYLTKGLKIEAENGLDIIDGYSLEKISSEKISNYYFDARALFHLKSKLIKAISIVIESKVSGNKYYICIPYANNSLTEMYWNQLQNYDLPLSKSYIFFLGKLYSEQIILNYPKK